MRSPTQTVGGFIISTEVCPEQDVKRLNSKRPPEKSDGLFGFNPNLGASRNNAVSHTAKKGGVWMPDIRRMGDDFVVTINGVIVRFESRDAAYAAWEENK